MLDVAMYTTIRKKTPYVQVRILFLTIVDRMKQLFILEEVAIRYRLRDLRQILVDDTARADIHMTYLRVTHLSVRQTYCQARSRTLNERALFFKFINDWCLCHVDCIVFVLI